MRSGIGAVALVVAALAAAVLPAPTATAASAGEQPLVGTFQITAGSCDGGVAGSTFRMVLPSGNAGGPFVSNNDSACGDRSYTLLQPGTDGGLITRTYQPEPNPAFDGNGNSLASRIIKPARFYGVDFSTSTNPKDPQTGVAVPAPSLSVKDGKLVGDLRAFAASWNRQEFNQGAPKPDGSSPGNTAVPSGTLNPTTGVFTLEWASQIQGGPFNNFTGLWHLEGRFVASSNGSGATTSGGGSPATAPTTPSPETAATGDTSSPGAPVPVVGSETTLAGSVGVSDAIIDFRPAPEDSGPFAAGTTIRDEDDESDLGGLGVVGVLALAGAVGGLVVTQARRRRAVPA